MSVGNGKRDHMPRKIKKTKEKKKLREELGKTRIERSLDSIMNPYESSRVPCEKERRIKVKY